MTKAPHLRKTKEVAENSQPVAGKALAVTVIINTLQRHFGDSAIFCMVANKMLTVVLWLINSFRFISIVYRTCSPAATLTASVPSY